MPIKRELRKYYNAKAGWPETRATILLRSQELAPERFEWLAEPDVPRCEQCGKPHHVWIETVTMRIVRNFTLIRAMWWRLDSTSPWRNSVGRTSDPPRPWKFRPVYVRLTVAHLNHTPGDDRRENLRGLCEWCHNNYDATIRAIHAHETRSVSKDLARPLLEAITR